MIYLVLLNHKVFPVLLSLNDYIFSPLSTPPLTADIISQRLLNGALRFRTQERKPDYFLELDRIEEAPDIPSIYPYERRLLGFLDEYPGELCSWEEISQAVLWGSADSFRRQEIQVALVRLRRFYPERHFYTVRGFGVVDSVENLEGKPIRLSQIGVSLFLQGEDGRKIIPGLSVLSSAVHENEAIKPESVFDLLDKLVWKQTSEEKVALLRPYLSSCQRQLLAYLAKGGFCSRKQLAQAAGIKSGVNLGVHLSALRKKTKSEGLEIFVRRSSGWLLGQRNSSDSFIYFPEGTGLREKIKALSAPPESNILRSLYFDPKSFRYPDQQTIALLDFLLQKPRELINYREVWQKIGNGKFDFQEESNRSNLKVHLFAARKLLEKTAPDKDWCLASVDKYSCLILCQGKIGETVFLPGLYDFSRIPKELREKLSLLMEKGILRDNSIVKPRFPQNEAKILLRLAQTPSEPVARYVLKDVSRSAESSLYKFISNLRRKLQSLGADMRIETERDSGYTFKA